MEEQRRFMWSRDRELPTYLSEPSPSAAPPPLLDTHQLLWANMVDIPGAEEEPIFLDDEDMERHMDELEVYVLGSSSTQEHKYVSMFHLFS